MRDVQTVLVRISCLISCMTSQEILYKHKEKDKEGIL